MLYAILIIIALVERLVWDLGPNIELVTLASIMVGMYGKGRYQWWVPVVIMFVSDTVLGWGRISWFTWSGFGLMVYMPKILSFIHRRFDRGMAAALMGVVWFYLWTNLGVWMTDQWGMYTKNLDSLIQCYINGLPFLKLQMFSALVTVPVGIVLYEWGMMNQWWGWSKMSNIVWWGRGKSRVRAHFVSNR